jgi:putative oxidoreductase
MTFPTQVRRLTPALERAEEQLTGWLARYSVSLLRISLGLVFFGFGVLKFFPGLSPAEPLAARTLDILTFGLVPERIGLTMVAGLETTIGLLLLSGRWLRLALALLAVELIGILSPIVLLPGEMFRGQPFAPTLAGQYVLKDIIVAAAGLVVAARALGARMVIEPTRNDAGPGGTERNHA